MKISKNMEWSRPYLDAVHAHVKVSSIKGYVVPPGKEVQTLGVCHKRRTKHAISIALNENSAFNTVSKPVRLEDVLFVLAHELAHTVEWDHTPEHLRVTANLLETFAIVSEKLGVKDTSLRLKRDK
jgi:hypothetical protein